MNFLTNITITKLLVQNGHSIFTVETGLKQVVEKYRRLYIPMVQEEIGRKPDFKLPFTSDDVIKIKNEINKNPRFKALADGCFCFNPPHHNKPEGTPCGCVHCTHFRPKK